MGRNYPSMDNNTITFPANQTGYHPNGYSECPCYLAIANVPWQYLNNLYEPARALQAGTAFPELDKPFTGRSVRG